jgi:hypothetical protein
LVIGEGVGPALLVVGKVAQGAVGFATEVGTLGFADRDFEVGGGGGKIAAGEAGDAAEVIGLVNFWGVGTGGDETVGDGFGLIGVLIGVEFEAVFEGFGVRAGAGGKEEGGQEEKRAKGRKRIEELSHPCAPYHKGRVIDCGSC